eukprot:5224759-Amphidinium_carterae.1
MVGQGPGETGVFLKRGTGFEAHRLLLSMASEPLSCSVVILLKHMTKTCGWSQARRPCAFPS